MLRKLDRERLKKIILLERNDLAKIAISGVLNDVPTHKIAKSLGNSALRFISSEVYINTTEFSESARKAKKRYSRGRYGLITPLVSMFILLAKDMARETKGLKGKEKKARLYEVLKEKKANETTKKEANDEVNEADGTTTEVGANDDINNNRKPQPVPSEPTEYPPQVKPSGEHPEIPELPNYAPTALNQFRMEPKLFYLISKHEDCAEDHVDYQGRLYIDSEYRKYLGYYSKEEQIEIISYILGNQLKTFQWVIDKPVWMITRRYCRHYYKALSASEVMKFTTDQLLDKYGMKSKEGKRGNRQTLKYDQRGYRNMSSVESIIRQYQDRLSFLLAVRTQMNTEELNRDITKTKLLISKWQEYLKNLL